MELLNGLNPEGMVQGDLDGNDVDDLVIDFGSAHGLWAWMNHTTWVRLHPWSPTLMVAGDLDNTGQDDVVAVFAAGTFVYLNNATWAWGFPPTLHLAVGNVRDAAAGDEVIYRHYYCTFCPEENGLGLILTKPGVPLAVIHAGQPSALLAADLDGNGLDEVIANFPGYGVYAYHDNSASWAPLHGFDAAFLAAGDLDGTGRDEVIVDFGAPYGLWILVSGTSWQLLTTLSADSAAVGDVDANGQADVVIDFGSVGLWILRDSATWQLLHAFNPEGVALGRFH